ncbi:MAG: ASKHA domain-containing protein [Methanobacteriaceae archaeon]
MDIRITFRPFNKSAFFKGPTNLIEAVRTAGFHLGGSCDGKGRCGKCKVKILKGGGLSPLTPEEIKFLTEEEIRAGVRLACFLSVSDDVEIEFSRFPEGMRILSHFRPIDFNLNPLVQCKIIEVDRPVLSSPRGDMEGLLHALAGQYRIGLPILRHLPDALRKGKWSTVVLIWNGEEIIRIEPDISQFRVYGIALDIGTTTVVAYLYDIKTGNQLGYISFVNPQIAMGEDVMTRISYSIEDPEGLPNLRETLIKELNYSIHKLCGNQNINPSEICEVTAVGNTVMHHLFLGIPVEYVGKAPFPPALQAPFDLNASELDLDLNPTAKVHMLPLIGGFVGSDIVGAMLAADIHNSKGKHLLIDIGTNGEIVLVNQGKFFCCSVAAGPAFEGGHLKHGMRALEGAIDTFKMDESGVEVKYTTVGNAPPAGVCGSGYLDILSEMLRLKYLLPQGRINPKVKIPRIRKGTSGTEFVITWSGEKESAHDIVITSDDIRELQLAKAAIFCGIRVLMEKVKVNKVDKIFLAGAFGNYLRPEAARIIGLFPEGVEVTPIGNAAGYGAILSLLSREKRLLAQEIVQKIEYVELASEPLFQERFMEAIPFPS